MEWQNNSTQGHWESALQEEKHGEKTASSEKEQSASASGFL